MDKNAQERVMDMVLKGSCPFSSLPPLNKKVVRIFVSSTFSDTKEERNALMRTVYPKLAEYCRDRFGLEFQVVDMRWGVPEHASDHHTTSQLCIDEIKKCQEVSVGPNFVTLLGHKYGYRPLPNTIDTALFDALAEAAAEAGDPLWETVTTWYLPDLNNKPPLYVLQPISGVIKDYNNTDNADVRRKAQQEWWTAEENLIQALRGNAARACTKGSITQDQKHMFFMSVTENEVRHGIIDGNSNNSVVAIVRDIPDIESYLTDKQAPRFTDTIPQEAKVDEEAANHLVVLRDKHLKERIPAENVTHVQIEWLASGANVSVDTVNDSSVAKFAQKFKKDELKITKHKTYLREMCNNFHKTITRLINEGAERNMKSYDDLTTELLQHQHLARMRCEVFEGRNDVIEKIESYIQGTSNFPLIIYGHSGCGKTSVLSRIYEILGDKYNGEKPQEEESESNTSNNDGIDARAKDSNAGGQADAEVDQANSDQNLEVKPANVNELLQSKQGTNSTNNKLDDQAKESNTDGQMDPANSSLGSDNVANTHNKDDTNTGDQTVSEHTTITKEKTEAPSKERKQKKMKRLKASNPVRVCPVVLLRFLGTTPLTSTIQQVLVTACKQISRIYNCPWTEPEKFSDLSKSFKDMLNQATKKRPLILIIDSIDQLMPVYGAYKVDWLPKTLPCHVKVILSTLVEGYPIYENLQKRYAGAQFIEILQLGDEIGMSIIKRWLDKSKRKITQEQEAVVRRALAICSLPLYARITYSHILRWPSYYSPDTTVLSSTVQEAISTMFQQMETKLGAPLVKHSLALLTASRYGLSEVELEHALSLDDMFLGHIYKFWRPPIRRVPPLLWTRVRNEISNYIVERSVDGILVLYWYHRQFIAATKARYLTDPTFLTHVHTILAELFLGKWSHGKAKPFEYTEHQKKRFALESTKSAEDRKVPSQPYIFDSMKAGSSSVRINERKVSELPLHLFKSRQTDLLLKEVFFNFEWLCAKIKSSSPRALMQEFELFMLSDKKLRNKFELKLLTANLQMMRPFIAKIPDCLSLEIVGRLAKYVGRQPLLTGLIKQCDTEGIRHCPLSPVATCFETADVGLKQNLHIRDTDPWHEGGAITCSKDFKSLYVLDYDLQGVSILQVWDIKSGDKVNERILDKRREINVQESDVYFHIMLDKTETVLIAFYKKRYYEGGLDKKEGYLDIIKLSTCSVDRTYHCPLQKKDFYNSLQFVTENWVCARFGRKNPMFSIHGDKAEIPLKTLNYVTQDEEYQVTLHPRLPNISMENGKPVRLENTRQRMGHVSFFRTRQHVSDLERSEEAVGLGVASGNRMLAVVDLKGTVIIYDLRHTQTSSNTRKIKNSRPRMYLPVAEHVTSIDIQEGETFDAYHQQVVEAKVIFSKDERFLITVYQSAWRSKWEAFLWNTTTFKYVRRIANNRSTRLKLPQFTADSNFVVMTSLDSKQLRLIHTESGQLVKTYDIGHVIRDFIASPKSTEIALLLQKDVMFVDANPAEIAVTPKGKGDNDQALIEDDIELLPRSQQTSTYSHPRLVLHQGAVQEVSGIAERYTTRRRSGRGGSAGSRSSSAGSVRHLALDTWESPDGETLVQLHSRAQVVDTKDNVIKYTPTAEDMIVPGNAEAEKIQEQWDSYTGTMDLNENDKIVSGNKVKLRVSSTDQGRYKILCVPSVIRISVIDHQVMAQAQKGAAADGAETTKQKLKLRRVKKITVFQQRIVTVSNKYVVTVNHTSGEEYIHVHEMVTGQYITHLAPKGGFGCARVSIDEKKLFVACKERTLKIFPTSNWDTEVPFTILPDKISSNKAIIHDILTFPENPDCVIMRYAREGPDAHFKSSYRHISLAEKKMSKALVVNPALEDITSDGSTGISNELKIYSLLTAEQVQQIQYTTDSFTHINARISEDREFVVFLDLSDDTLHVYRISGETPVHVTSCFTHSTQLLTSPLLRLRQNGRLIVLRGSTTSAFAIRDFKEAKHRLNRKTDHASDVFRARAVMRCTAVSMETVVKKEDKTENTASAKPLPPIAPTREGTRNIDITNLRPKTPYIEKDLKVLDRQVMGVSALPPIANKES